VTVDVHHIRDASPRGLPPADLYLFSSPGRMGRPIGSMRRFLKKVELPAGTEYAILTTEAGAEPDKPTEKPAAEKPAADEDAADEDMDRWQRVTPIIREILLGKGLVEVAAEKVFVTGLKGPLEEGWKEKVAAFATRIPVPPTEPGH
jgi:hypothetical protein